MLDLSDNPLGPTLPEDVAVLPSLATLNCSNCGLQALPDALGGAQQPKLSALSVFGNVLTSLPSGLACAGALVVLKASNNQLAELPGRLLKGWIALRELDLSHNQLQVWAQETSSAVARCQHAVCLQAHTLAMLLVTAATSSSMLPCKVHGAPNVVSDRAACTNYTTAALKPMPYMVGAGAAGASR